MTRITMKQDMSIIPHFFIHNTFNTDNSNIPICSNSSNASCKYFYTITPMTSSYVHLQYDNYDNYDINNKFKQY